MLSSFAEIAAAFPWFFPVVAVALGACIGSFLNVVIYRVPAEKSVVTPGSHCACGQPIKWYDNIPVLSWLLLRGKARCCGRAFSFRYPFVELLTAALFLVCWLRFYPEVGTVICGWIFISALICATFIDLDHMIIPDVFTLGLGVCGVILSLIVPSLHGQHDDFFALSSLRSGAIALQGLLIGSGFLLWFALLTEVILKKETMGFGDVKFVGAIGAFCGWQGAIFSIFGGAIVGMLWFAITWLWQKLAGKSSPLAPRAETPEGAPAALGFGVHIPFGPMLAIAGALYFLCFRTLADAWLSELTMLF